jgi:hypothetical protein
MNENQQNFDELKRLLKLKQHEVPPPGYFNNFSGEVISRIRAGERARRRTLLERMEIQMPWFLNITRIFEIRPGVIGGFAASLCLLLVLGVVFADYSERSSQKLFEITGPSAPVGNAVASLTAPVAPTLMASDSGGITVSTNPVVSLQPATTLFGQPASSPLFQTASFVTGY